MPTRYLICGGREFNDALMMHRALRNLILRPEDAIVVHGDARGADRMAAEWAKANGAKVEAYPIPRAAWEAMGRAAGPIHNRMMLEGGKPDVVIAFPGGKGTADMVRRVADRRRENDGLPILIQVTFTGAPPGWGGSTPDV